MPNNSTDIDVPLRLLDCFGLITPSVFFAIAAILGAVGCLRVLDGFGGELAAFRTGEFVKNAVGEGIVIVSISNNEAPHGIFAPSKM